MAGLTPAHRVSCKQHRRRHACYAAVMTLLALVSSMGCLNMSFGGKWVTSDTSEVLEQTETVSLTGSVNDVFYPIPYASPPHLSITNPASFVPMAPYEILEQKADHFRIKSNNGAGITLAWTARGTRAVQAAVVPAAPDTEEAANPAPPAVGRLLPPTSSR
jgi:hypothetical protein